MPTGYKPQDCNLQARVVLFPTDIKRLAFMARGYTREYPKRKWSRREYREAARLAVTQIVLEKLGITEVRKYYDLLFPGATNAQPTQTQADQATGSTSPQPATPQVPGPGCNAGPA